MRHAVYAFVFGLVWPAVAAAQPSFYSHDNYTQYELLDPETHQFAITYYVTERQAGALYLLNQTRSGSEGSGIAVFDPQTGKPLKFDYMTGAELSAAGTRGRLDPAEHYIRAHLPRPVPEGGEGRVRILKTYKDEKSYFTEGESIVFKRSLGIARNAIVLPKGFRLVSSNVASQMFTLADGRLKISFEHPNGYAADVTIRARKFDGAAPPGEAAPAADRTFDFSKILFDVQDDGKRVMLTREYVETAPGNDARLHRPMGIGDDFVVTDVDSGLTLDVTTRANAAFARLPAPIAAPDGSARLRISGPMRGGVPLDGRNMNLDLQINAARAVILLPSGWDVVLVSVPATVATQSDGRVAIQIFNTAPMQLGVNLRATKR